MITIALLCAAPQTAKTSTSTIQALIPRTNLVAITNGFEIREGGNPDVIAIVRPAGAPTIQRRPILDHPEQASPFAVVPFDVVSGIGRSGRVFAFFPLSDRQASAGVNALPVRNYLLLGVAAHGGKLEKTIKNERLAPSAVKSNDAQELWAVSLVTTPQTKVDSTGGLNATLVRAVADACAVDAHDPLHDPYELALDLVRSDRGHPSIDDQPLVSPDAEGVFGPRLSELSRKAPPATRLKLLAVKMSTKIEGSTNEFVDELEQTVNLGQDEGRWDTCSTGLRNIEPSFVNPVLCDRMARLASKAKSPAIVDYALRNAGFPSKDRQQELLTLLDRPEPELRWRFLTSLANWNHRPDLEPKLSPQGNIVNERSLIRSWRSSVSAQPTSRADRS